MRFNSAGVLLVVAASATLLLLVIPMMRAPSPWGPWEPASCMPERCFCEAIRPSLIRQPANALSSLSFVVVAMLVLLRSSSARARSSETYSNLMVAQPAYPKIYAFALVLIGFGSAFFHASLSFVGQTADVLGMYLLATFMVLYGVSRLRKLSSRGAVSAYLSVNAVLLWLLVIYPSFRRYAFAVLVLLALTLERLVRKRRGTEVSARANLLGAAIGLLAVGFILWVLDITKVLCAPHSWLQGHSIWHFLGSSSTALLYLYYESEARVTQAGALSR